MWGTRVTKKNDVFIYLQYLNFTRNDVRYVNNSFHLGYPPQSTPDPNDLPNNAQDRSWARITPLDLLFLDWLQKEQGLTKHIELWRILGTLFHPQARM
jgi:hypothetical protein